MQLRTLLNGFATCNHDAAITGLSLDSRKIKAGHVFVALEVADQAVIQHVKQALALGACAVIYDPNDTVLRRWLAEPVLDASEKKPIDTCAFIALPTLASQLGALAARFYAHPSEKLAIIGITGTNGKTSCSQFLGQLLDSCGIIGTLGWGVWGQLALTGYTTPDALATQAMLAEFVNQAQRNVVMEVSSHGLAEGRVNAVRFKGVVLTNISRDHLDFHGSMENYIATKQALFTHSDTEFAVFNLDDALSEQFIAIVPEQVAIWGFCILATTISGAMHRNAALVGNNKRVYAQNISHHVDGLSFELGWQDQLQTICVPLYGEFNVENLLAVVTVLLAMGQSLAAISANLQRLKPVTGRMQRFGNLHSALIFVDYAHTPDALEKALISARQHCQRNVWVVFGCGGDRDAGKRSQMGACAQKYADHVIITDDNPRSENPAAITQAILSGCQSNQGQSTANITVIHDREQAIRTVIAQASTEDCIVIAGKGHELYQEYHDKKILFSDEQVVMNSLKEWEAR